MVGAFRSAGGSPQLAAAEAEATGGCECEGGEAGEAVEVGEEVAVHGWCFQVSGGFTTAGRRGGGGHRRLRVRGWRSRRGGRGWRGGCGSWLVLSGQRGVHHSWPPRRRRPPAAASARVAKPARR